MDGERFVRQILVVEIGEQGQRAISSATADVGGEGFAHEVAVRYAARAGFGRVGLASEPLSPGVPGDWVREPAAREALAGARAALRALTRAIATKPTEGGSA